MQQRNSGPSDSDTEIVTPAQKVEDEDVASQPALGQPVNLNFTVDAALLQELGERLVGKPFIALAELVKNSYDADASDVVLTFHADEIEISDNGHGMDFAAFRDRWMRVGSPHKRSARVSPVKLRPLTGSKGVGRLSAQFLSSNLTVVTTSIEDVGTQLEVGVDWRDIPGAKNLQDVQATACVEISSATYPAGSSHGTIIRLKGLRQSWGALELRELAQQLWFLQPPSKELSDFQVQIKAADMSLVESFDQQMKAILNVWYARLEGRVVEDKGLKQVLLKCSFRGGQEFSVRYPEVGSSPQSEEVDAEVEESERSDREVIEFAALPRNLTFDIRIYHLNYRQPDGITVADARNYMNEYGGVHVYDAGFRLPFYGPETDWLNIEQDHAHRLSRSKLLPDILQVQQGLNYLPTNSRLLGAVAVNTSNEESGGSLESLSIAITRDRLIENSAFVAMQRAVRWSVDFYAVQEAKRRFEDAQVEKARFELPEVVSGLKETLEAVKPAIPTSTYVALKAEVTNTERAAAVARNYYQRQSSLVATLATAGMSALAYEHETAKQLVILSQIADELSSIRGRDQDENRRLADATSSIKHWLERARGLRGLFDHLQHEENRDDTDRLRVKATVEVSVEQLRPLLRGIGVDCSGVDKSLRFPPASFAELFAIIQNVVVNAVNAMLDSPERRIFVSGSETGARTTLRFQDLGVGVDLSDSDELFKPFVRRLKLSPERSGLGLGGTGLGLSIVKMICENIGCQVRFVTPDVGYSTCLEITWRTL